MFKWEVEEKWSKVKIRRKLKSMFEEIKENRVLRCNIFGEKMFYIYKIIMKLRWWDFRGGFGEYCFCKDEEVDCRRMELSILYIDK